MRKYKKDNITLQLRVPVDFAISIIGRLYGRGLISRENYMAKLKKISQMEAVKEQKKSEKLERILKNAANNKFFNKKVVYF